jgi:hypothetical protein
MGKLIVILIFVGIGIIRKIAEQSAKKRQQQAAGGRANVPRDQRGKVQSEIEAFLQGVTGDKKPPQQEQQRPRRRPRSERQAQRPQQRKPQPPARKPSPATEPARLSVSGSSISEHVDQFIGQHVSQHIDHGIEEHVNVEIVDNVQEHLGDRDIAGGQKTGRSAPNEILALLRTPEGMRQAIIANEILSRPRTLRR